MLSLVELQRAMRDAILATPSSALLAEIDADADSSRRRLAVYRNHFRVSLKQGLAQLFPATRVLLGERFFDAVAALFLTTNPPCDPRLAVFGEAFPRFLALHDTLAEFAFVPEVARLEWTLASVAAAAAVTPRPLSDYDRAMRHYGKRFWLRLTPSTLLFESDWQVNAIRSQVLAGDAAEHIGPLAGEPRPLRRLLHRDADNDACELPLDEAGYTMLRHLRAARSVAEACEAALAVQPDYPVPALLIFLFETGLVADLGPSFAPATGAPAGVLP